MSDKPNTVEKIEDCLRQSAKLDVAQAQMADMARRLSEATAARIGDVHVLCLVDTARSIRIRLYRMETQPFFMDVEEARGLAGWLNAHVGWRGQGPQGNEDKGADHERVGSSDGS